MGNVPNRTTNSFCLKCFGFTKHNVYEDRKESSENVGYYEDGSFKHDHTIFHTTITTTEVCTKCGNSSSKSQTYTSESCSIF